MPSAVSDEFLNDQMEDGEDVHRYHPGGLHPVHLGDLLDGSRYKVIHKLGHGASSTVWLARDRSLRKYVAVKIKESDISNSKLQNELDILKHLSRATSDHPGRIYSAASLLLRYFWIDGPNGRHLALVFQVLGPSISQLNHWLIRLHTCLARNIVLQVTQGLEYIHSEGICHGDFTSSNVLFQLSNFDSWSEYKLQTQLGTPEMSIIEERPGRPRYLVDSASFFDAEPGLLTRNITIVDHSESFFVKSPPSHELHTTNHYTAPEVLFGSDASVCSDIWALGCLIYEIRAGFPLFVCAINNTPVEAVGEIIVLLGKIPSSWNDVQFNEEGYLERDGCENPVDLSIYPGACPLYEQVNCIVDKQINLPDINIGSKGPKAPGEVGNKPFSSDVAGSKIHPSLRWKSILLARTTGVYLTECFSAQLLVLVQATTKKDMEPFPRISVTESGSLTDLLSKILTYEPEDRLSLIDITKHPWVTASVVSQW